MCAQPRSRPRSPIATMCASSRSAQSRTQSSGPIPAGSPEVSAMTGLFFVKPYFDVTLVAQLAQPLLVGLVGLALAQHLPRLQHAALRVHLGRAPLEHLEEVIAERLSHRLADLALLELVIGALEIAHRVAGIDPVELAAAARRAVVGMHARPLGRNGLAVCPPHPRDH